MNNFLGSPPAGLNMVRHRSFYAVFRYHVPGKRTMDNVFRKPVYAHLRQNLYVQLVSMQYAVLVHCLFSENDETKFYHAGYGHSKVVHKS